VSLFLPPRCPRGRTGNALLLYSCGSLAPGWYRFMPSEIRGVFGWLHFTDLRRPRNRCQCFNVKHTLKIGKSLPIRLLPSHWPVDRPATESGVIDFVAPMHGDQDTPVVSLFLRYPDHNCSWKPEGARSRIEAAVIEPDEIAPLVRDSDRVLNWSVFRLVVRDINASWKSLCWHTCTPSAVAVLPSTSKRRRQPDRDRECQPKAAERQRTAADSRARGADPQGSVNRVAGLLKHNRSAKLNAAPNNGMIYPRPVTAKTAA
jgi:hypothetical protein